MHKNRPTAQSAHSLIESLNFISVFLDSAHQEEFETQHVKCILSACMFPHAQLVLWNQCTFSFSAWYEIFISWIIDMVFPSVLPLSVKCIFIDCKLPD